MSVNIRNLTKGDDFSLARVSSSAKYRNNNSAVGQQQCHFVILTIITSNAILIDQLTMAIKQTKSYASVQNEIQFAEIRCEFRRAGSSQISRLETRQRQQDPSYY